MSVRSLSRLAGLAFAGLLLARPAAAARLHVVVDGIHPHGGPVRLALFDQAKGFPESGSLSGQTRADSGARAVFEWDGLPAGRYAVAAYQDLNRDGRLDRSLLGRPVEPFGFSNAASAGFGPPDFAAAAFALRAAGASITVHLGE